MNQWNGGSHGGLNSKPHDQINENNITPGGMNSVPLRSGKVQHQEQQMQQLLLSIKHRIHDARVSE